jgi:hypothetical protein
VSGVFGFLVSPSSSSNPRRTTSYGCMSVAYYPLSGIRVTQNDLCYVRVNGTFTITDSSFTLREGSYIFDDGTIWSGDSGEIRFIKSGNSSDTNFYFSNFSAATPASCLL